MLESLLKIPKITGGGENKEVRPCHLLVLDICKILEVVKVDCCKSSHWMLRG